MQTTVSIPFVDEALGHSVIYEEHRGDYERARLIAEERLDAAQGGGDPTVLADALLARGVVHLLQGEPPAAIRCFNELERAVPDDYDRRLRAAGYANLATFWHYNRFPDGGGAGGTELSARWDGQAYLEAQTPRWRELFAGAQGTPSRFESMLVKDFLPTLQAPRAFVQTGRFSGAGAASGQLLEAALGTPQDMRANAEVYGAAPSLLAYADLAAADLCKRAGDPQKGWGYLQRAWEAYQESGDVAGMANCQMIVGDWRVAPFSTPQVWNLVLQEGASSGSDLAWTLEAVEFSDRDINLAAANEAYDEAERLFLAANGPRGVASVQLRRGYLAILEGYWDGALEQVTGAQEQFEACGDRLGYWLAQTHRVLCRIGAGHFPEERETAEAIGAWGVTEGSFSYALGLGLLMGRVGRHWLIRRADCERALACYRLAEVLYAALGAATNQAQSVVDRGSVHHTIGARTTAMTLYEEALDLYAAQKEAPSPIPERVVAHVIMLATDLYQVYLRAMDSDGMERSAKRIEGQLEALPGEGSDLGVLTQTLTNGLSGVEAFGLSRLARSTLEQSKVLAPLYRGRQARDDGDQETANRLFAEALAAAQAAADDERDFLEAQAYGLQRAYPQAKEAFERYLARGGAGSGFLGVLASVMQAMGGDAGQQEVRRQQRRTKEQAFAFMVRIKEHEEARRYLAEIEELTDAGEEWWKADSQPWLVLSDVGEMYEGLGDLEAALHNYDRAIGELEAVRTHLSRDELKTALAAGSGTQHMHFQAARVALTLAQQVADRSEAERYAARAFDYLERGKARALLDLMAGSAAMSGTSAAESEAMRDWRQCTAQLAVWRGLLARERSGQNASQSRTDELTQLVDAQEDELRRIEDELAQSDPAFYRSLNPQAEVVALGDVCDALPPGTALLQYAFLGNDLLAWAITRKGMVVKHQARGDAKALGRKIRGFHEACSKPPSDRQKAQDEEPAKDLGEELAATLLAPLKAAIQEHPHLVIVPYGPAHTLPFQALPWDGDVLAANHSLSYLPSASALTFLGAGQVDRLPDRILAIGNPKDMAYHPPLGGKVVSASELPAAELEAVFVASLHSEGKDLTGPQATEKAVRKLLPNYPLLHFATHGMLSEEAPLLSAILLANGEALNVYELMGLRLDADLVVLSACRTALGELTGGDDVIGLTRGLLGAGARAAVVSLWPVEDVSTSLLMGEFYRQLRGEKPKPPQVALQAAQNYLRGLDPDQIEEKVAGLRDLAQDRDLAPEGASPTAEDYTHPHFWAPFVLVG